MIDFAVPYCTHYVLYDPSRKDQVIWLKGQVGNYLSLIGPVFDGSLAVSCPKDGCGLSFYLMTDIDEFQCPSCNSHLRRDKEAKTVEVQAGYVW
jgi:DNA-directed RNA polymerase subunit RPC12/RpoP